jgi:hypothetical protein
MSNLTNTAKSEAQGVAYRAEIFSIFFSRSTRKIIPMLSFISRQTTESAMKNKSFSKFHLEHFGHVE